MDKKKEALKTHGREREMGDGETAEKALLKKAEDRLYLAVLQESDVAFT